MDSLSTYLLHAPILETDTTLKCDYVQANIFVYLYSISIYWASCNFGQNVLLAAEGGGDIFTRDF